jgi:hypothetical protein
MKEKRLKNRISDQRVTLGQSDSTMLPVTQQASEEEIAQRAYEIYLQRGAGDGSDLDDWLQAERELSQGAQVSERAAAAIAS